MKIKDLTPETRAHYIERIRRITEASDRRWGTLTPAQMFDHLSRTIESSIGDRPVDGNGVLLFKVAKRIVLSGVAPFPPNVLKTPPVFEPNGTGTVSTERDRLEALIDRFLEARERNPKRAPMNPLFGPMTMKQWGRLHGLHLNHHLAQFGVKG